MLAGIVSSFIGITLANYTKNLFPDYLYAGSYVMLAIVTFIPVIFFIFMKIKIILTITQTLVIRAENYLK